MQDQSKFKLINSLHNIIKDIVSENIEGLELTYDQYDNRVNRNGTERRTLNSKINSFFEKKVNKYISKLIKDNDLYLYISNNREGHNYPTETYIKPQSINSVQSHFVVIGGDNNHIQIRIDRIYFTITYSTIKIEKHSNKIIILSDSNEGNQISQRELDIYMLMKKTHVYDTELKKSIEEVKELLLNKKSEIKELINSIENSEYILSYMNKNNITSEDKVNLKSRILLEFINDKDIDTNTLRTQLNEIISIKL